MLAEMLSPEALTALVSVVLIDIALAGDNAVVVGMAAAGLPTRLRTRAILAGVLAAAILRIAFSLFTVELLQVIGLLLAGGLLLLWVAWKLWREIRTGSLAGAAAPAPGSDAADTSGNDPASRDGGPPQKTFRQAVIQIVIADVSMSLDNVLAVAGAAREHASVLIFGLALSVALMGLAATLIARLLHRHRWIAYAGFVVILYVALRMIWDGGLEVFTALR
ncbi:MAG: YjbE family putative metal transport protein [Rhodospirillales bacterium]|nr:YjbE family putative metal transport protein [Rhodospirillales bacterium]